MSKNRKKQTLADAGEYAFIESIRSMMPSDGGALIRSIGDDCLVTEIFKDGPALYTVDTFVDGVHFKDDFFSFGQIGGRCMAAAVSDIAAMGGVPVHSLVSLSMPRDMLLEDADALFRGLSNMAEKYHCPVAGGETTSTPGPLTISITVIGRGVSGVVITRSGARAGNGIYVTGSIGGAMAGLLAFEHGEEGYERLREKFVAPEARVHLAQKLAERYRITAMIDLSDGLATDLANICRESGCGAEIHEVLLPVTEDVRTITAKHGIETTEFALNAGEDFELLFTSGDTALDDSFKLMGVAVTRIGTITDQTQAIRLVRENGGVVELHATGYEHFRL